MKFSAVSFVLLLLSTAAFCAEPAAAGAPTVAALPDKDAVGSAAAAAAPVVQVQSVASGAAAAAASAAAQASAAASAAASAVASAAASAADAASGAASSAAAAAPAAGAAASLSRVDEAERWTDMSLEATPHLPSIPRGNVRHDVSNLVLNIDLDQRMTEAGAAQLWPRFSSIERMCTPEYSIAFWIDVNDDTGKDWRTIFYKGGKKGERAPAMFLHPVTKRLQFHQTVQTGTKEDIMVLSSDSGIPLYTPTHVAVIRRGKTTEIYINGKAEGSATHEGVNVCNEDPLHLNPTVFGLKSFTGRLRNFRWYSLALSPNDIKRLNFEGFDNSLVSIAFRKRYSGSVEDGDIVPHDDSLSSEDWTVATWIKLAEQPLGIPQRVFQKGADSSEHAPSLTILPGTNKLSLRVNTENYLSEGLLSPFELRVGQPTHVACVKAGLALRLYLNGVLSKEIRLSGAVKPNTGALYLARSSSSSSHNGMSGEMTSFKWYDRAFTGADVAALASATAPRPILSFDSDRSTTAINAAEFPHSSKLNLREFTVEFWVRFLSSKFSSLADKKNKASQQDINDAEASSQDDDSIRSEEQLLNDEFAETTPSAIDPDLAALTRKQKAEEDLALRVQGAATTQGNGAPEQGGRSVSDIVRSAYDSAKLGRFEAYDREHMGSFDDDIARGNVDNGYEAFGDDSLQREPGGKWATAEAEKEETAEMIDELKKLKQKVINEADAGSTDDDSKDSSLDAAVDGGYKGITGPAATKSSVIRNNEDRVTNFGDQRTSEDEGRKSRESQLRDGAIDLSNAVPRPDEEGTHLNDDDMDSDQKPDEEGTHAGDTIDDNQLMAPGGRNPEDRDIDPYLYGGNAKTGAYRKPKAKGSYTLLQTSEGITRKLLGTAEEQPGSALADAAAASGRVEDAVVSSTTAADSNAASAAASASAAAASASDAPISVHTGAPTDPANPLTEEMSDKERATPVVPKPTNFADGDDAARAKRTDFEVSADGEEAADETGRDVDNGVEEVKAGDDVAAIDNGHSADKAGSPPRAEPADDSYAAESTTGTTDVPGKDDSDAVSADAHSDDATMSGAEDQTPEATSVREEEEENQEDTSVDEAGGSEPPASTEATDGRRYDERYEDQSHPETPGNRPKNDLKPIAAAPTRADLAQVAPNDAEGDYTGGDLPSTLALFRKGSKWSHFTPTLQLVTETMKLRARVSTTAAVNETLVSRGSLYTKQPNHVAMTVNGRTLRLYINGVLDSEKHLEGSLKFNDGPLRVARDLRVDGVLAHLSKFRLHPRALRQDELRQIKYSLSVPLRAYYNELVGDHLYSSRPLMKGVSGYRYLGIKGWVQSGPVPGSIPLYRFYNQALGDHRYSIDRLDDGDSGYAYSGIVGYVYPQYRKNSAALIEYYNEAVGDHFYTTDANEVGDSFYAGYNKVGTICYVEVERTPARPMFRYHERVGRPSAVLDVNERTDFDGKKNLRVLSSEMADSTPKAWSLAMWVEIFDDATGEIRTLFRRGNSTEAQTPSAYLQPTNNQLEFQITTTQGVEKWFSKSDLPIKALTHIALTYDGKSVKFFINGQLDVTFAPQGTITASQFPLTLGAGVKSLDGPGFRGRIRDARWYDRAISTSSLERVTSVAPERPALVFSYSPRFKAATTVVIPDSRSYMAKEWSLFFTIEATGDCEDTLCNIIDKGSQLKVGVNTAGLLEATITTEAKETVTVKSAESLAIKTPASVAVVYENNNLFLYVDGVLSNTAAVEGAPVFSNSPVTLGAVGEVKALRSFITALEWHRRAFSQAEIVERADAMMPPVLLNFERKDRFDLNTSISVAAGREFSTIGITVTFWIKLLHHTDFMTNILSRGEGLTQSNPAILLRKDGRIQVLVETGNILQSCLSHSVLPLNIPTHVGVSRSGRTIKIFINGREDSVHVSGFPFKDNTANVVIGKASEDLPAPLAWIRELQWHDTALERPAVDRLMHVTL
jgi:hypothetical protein